MKNVRFAAVLSLLTGCSLINSLDSVKPAIDGDAGHGKGSGGKGAGGAGEDGGSAGASGKGNGGASAGGAGNGGMGGEMPDASDTGGSAGTGGRGTGGRGTGGTPVDVDGGDSGPPFVPGGPNGAIVVYDTGGKKLHVLDPKNGHALSSETAVRILAVSNDPVSDNWYIFQQPGKPTDPVFLQVRQLNTVSGAWHDLGKPVQVPTPTLTSVGVLNKRIAYLAVPDAAGSDPTVATLTVLDTSKPEAVVVHTKNKDIGVPGQRVALLARPDGAQVGGTGTIAIQSACVQDATLNPPATVCDVGLLRLLVNSTTVSLPESTPTNVGRVNSQGGSMGFAVDYQSQLDVLLSPPVVNPSTAAVCNAAVPTGVLGHAAEYGVVTHAVQVGPFDFEMPNLRVNSAAFDSCHKIAFATSLLNNTAIWAIPMATGGKPEMQCKDGGGSMLFEPYTHALLRVPIAGDRIEAYDIDDKTATEPHLTSRPMSLPAGFSTGGILAVRQPLSGCVN